MLIVHEHIVKYLYRINFEWPDKLNGPIISFLCYVETPQEAEAKAREFSTTKARDMQYIGVEAMPYGAVTSSCSVPQPPTIMVDGNLDAKKGVTPDARVQK